VMLAGLALTQLGHLQMLQQPGHGVTRSYAVVLLLQSVGFYWLLLGVLRQPPAWRGGEWALPPAVLLLAVLVPTGWAVPAGLALGSLFALHLGVLSYRLRAMRRRFGLELGVTVLFAAMAMAAAVAGLLAPGALGWDGYA